MNYRKLGNTGLQISELGLGSWLTIGDQLDLKQSETLIKTAFDGGINFFETADSYAHGRAEEFLGKILSAYRREEFVIASKCFFPVHGKESWPNSGGLSRKHIFDAVHHSLRRLKIDYIDLMQCHRPDPNTSIEETVDAFNDLIRQGKVLYWGVSKWNEAAIAAANKYSDERLGYKICSSQDLYNLFHREVEVNHLNFCDQHGMGFLAYSPLARGVLSGKYLNGIPEGSRAADKEHMATVYDLMPEKLEKLKILEAIAKKYAVDMAAVTIAFYLNNRAISSLILGATHPDQIKNNTKACGLKLNKEDMAQISQVFV